MANSPNRTGGRRSAPAAGLLAQNSSAKVIEHDALEPDARDGFPSEPPPVPEGESLGFDGPPAGATDAAPITEVVVPSGGTPVDPITGEEAFVPETTRAGKNEALKAELEAAECKLEAERLHAAGQVPRPQTVSPVDRSLPEDHAAKQRAYRERMAEIRRTPAEIVQTHDEDLGLEVESPEEARARLKVEAKEAYEAKVAAMAPDEPVYLATGRAPRPKVCGHQLAPGDVVPGAYLYTRLESWVGAGIITRAN